MAGVYGWQGKAFPTATSLLTSLGNSLIHDNNLWLELRLNACLSLPEWADSPKVGGLREFEWDCI